MHQIPFNQMREHRIDVCIQTAPTKILVFPLFGTNHSALRNKAFIAVENVSTHRNFLRANGSHIYDTRASTGSNITRITTSPSYGSLSPG